MKQRSLEVTGAEPSVCHESLSVTLALGVGEEKHCWAMVKAVRSWGRAFLRSWLDLEGREEQHR